MENDNLFVLPYFRERTFTGEKGRLRSRVVVDADKAQYESSSKENHIDFAARYSHTIGDWDFGIYHFKGTGREPSYKSSFNFNDGITVVPFYEQIDQTGLDLQAVKGDWLLKLESIYRTGQGENYYASAGGFEYSFVNMASSGMDLGLIVEWAYDERGEDAMTVFDNDLMLGARLAVNDAASTEALVAIIEDLDTRGRILSLESSRRLGDRLKVSLSSYIVLDVSTDDLIYYLRDDDYLQLEMAYFF